MARTLLTICTCALALTWATTGSAYGQGGGASGGTGQAGTTGQADTTGQAGTTGQPGQTVPTQGQVPAKQSTIPGQGAGAPNPTGNAQGTTQAAPIQQIPGGVNQMPFFNNGAVRKHLNMTDQQYNDLIRSYEGYYNAYRGGLGAANANAAELANQFNNGMLKSAGSILNPGQMTRFQQLYLQTQGLAMFSNPQVQQQLNLTPQQQQQLQQLSTQSNQQLNQISTTAGANPQAVNQQMQQLRQQEQQSLNQILTPQQQQTFRSMIGEPFTFTGQ